MEYQNSISRTWLLGSKSGLRASILSRPSMCTLVSSALLLLLHKIYLMVSEISVAA